jgi:hypothetical protein
LGLATPLSSIAHSSENGAPTRFKGGRIVDTLPRRIWEGERMKDDRALDPKYAKSGPVEIIECLDKTGQY